MVITRRTFGTTTDGHEVSAFTLANENGIAVTVLDYGVTVQKLLVPDKSGKTVDVVLGFSDMAGYEKCESFLGATIGRFANRIEKGCFFHNGEKYTLDCNDGENHLHSGKTGFHKRIFDAHVLKNGVAFSLISKENESGYPGNISTRTTVTLSDDNELTFRYNALTDADTPYNPTNHSYFNLNGHESGDIYSHKLWMNAPLYTPNRPDAIPTGEIVSVKDTPMDFYAEPKEIGRDIHSDYEQIKLFSGYDHNFVLKMGQAPMHDAATLVAGERRMTVSTTMPGMQLYTANVTDEVGKNGAKYRMHSALCLETQFFPNSVNEAHFPSPILKTGTQFRSETTFKFDCV